MTAAPSRFLALVFGLAFLVLSDCCLNGSHQHGDVMAAYGPICRALR